MADALAKKKRIRAGHKASATRTMSKIDDALSAARFVYVNFTEADHVGEARNYASFGLGNC